MATDTYKNASGATQYRKVIGAGSSGDPTVCVNTLEAAAIGGWDAYSAISTSAVLTAQIKGSAGRIRKITAFNVNAAARFVRIYNQTGAPASTDAANIVWRGIIPGNTAGAGFTVELDIQCSTGIGIRASAAVADNDTTVLAANELFFNVTYK